MKSTTGASKGRWYLTHEFSYERIIEQTVAATVSASLGFPSEPVTHEQVVAELDRVKARRAALIADIVAAIPVAPPVDPAPAGHSFVFTGTAEATPKPA